MRAHRSDSVVYPCALALMAGAMLLPTITGPRAEAGNFFCSSGSCWISTFSGKCFHCLVNPAPAYCSCSALGTCPTAATLCGNCDLACGGTVVACTDKCPGCSSPFYCGPTGSATASQKNNLVPVQPNYPRWVDDDGVLSGVSRASPLMVQLLLHMRQAKEQWGCSYLTGWVIDPTDPQPLQSKVIVHSNEEGITSFTIINRTTGRDEILTVDVAGNSWQLRTAPSYASGTPELAVIAAQGTLPGREGDSSAPNVKDAGAAQIHPTYTQWIQNRTLFERVSAVSPLMREVLLQLRSNKGWWDTSYFTGLVVNPSDRSHLQSKMTAYSNEYGITKITIINRSNDRDEVLTVHAAKGIWSLRSLPSYAPRTPEPPVILAKGTLHAN